MIYQGQTGAKQELSLQFVHWYTQKCSSKSHVQLINVLQTYIDDSLNIAIKTGVCSNLVSRSR